MNIHIITAVTVLISLGIGISGQDMMSFMLNTKFMKKQISCLLETDTCDTFGAQLQRLLPSVLHDDCNKRCNMQQKLYVTTLIDFMRSRYPNDWRAVQKKYHLKREGLVRRGINYKSNEEYDEYDQAEDYVNVENEDEYNYPM